MNIKTLSLEVIQSKIGEVQLESLLKTLDRLHEAAANQNLAAETTLDAEALVGWLEDIVFTAQEAIKEVQQDVQPDTLDLADIPGPAVLKVYRQG